MSSPRRRSASPSRRSPAEEWVVNPYTFREISARGEKYELLKESESNELAEGLTRYSSKEEAAAAGREARELVKTGVPWDQTGIFRSAKRSASPPREQAASPRSARRSASPPRRRSLSPSSSEFREKVKRKEKDFLQSLYAEYKKVARGAWSDLVSQYFSPGLLDEDAISVLLLAHDIALISPSLKAQEKAPQAIPRLRDAMDGSNPRLQKELFMGHILVRDDESSNWRSLANGEYEARDGRVAGLKIIVRTEGAWSLLGGRYSAAEVAGIIMSQDLRDELEGEIERE